MTEDHWWVDENGHDTCPCHARYAPMRCARCGERLSDHGGIEEPICRDPREDSPQAVTYQEALLEGADPDEGFYD